jgi:hypothetical protein
MEGIIISDIIVDGTLLPIFIRLENWARLYRKDVLVIDAGTIEDVTISNILVKITELLGVRLPGFPVIR